MRSRHTDPGSKRTLEQLYGIGNIGVLPNRGARGKLMVDGVVPTERAGVRMSGLLHWTV